METLADLIDRFRDEHRDTAEPYLWTTQQLIDWANEAYSEFAKITQTLHDKSSVAAIYPVKVGQSSIRLHPSVFDVSRAFFGGRQLELVPHLHADPRRLPKTGIPRFLVLYPMPVVELHAPPFEAGTLELEVLRDQLDPLDLNASLEEIPRFDRQHLLLFMANKAYAVPDVEVYDAAKSQQYLAQFNYQCQRIYERVSRMRGDLSKPIPYRGL